MISTGIRDNILFKKEFDDWSNINKNLKIIYTISEDQHGQQSSTTAKNDDWKGEDGNNRQVNDFE